MSDMFKSYERDFSKHLAAANKKVSALATSPSDLLVSEAREDLQQAERFLKLMESELDTLSPSIASQYQPRVKRHKENTNTLKQALSNEQIAANRAALGSQKPNIEKRDKLQWANEVLYDSGNTLERAIKVGIETEQIGNDTMNDLYRQRKQLQGMNEQLYDVNTNLKIVNQVVSKMDRRRFCMKLLMYVIILLLIISIAIVIYIKMA
jgi:hypothetical protein